MQEKKYLYLFFLLNCLNFQAILSIGFGDFQSTFNIGLNLEGKTIAALDKLEDKNVSDADEGDLFGDRTITLLEGLTNKVDEISSTLNVVNNNIQEKFHKLQELIIDLADDQKKSALMLLFSNSVDRIHYVYDQLLNFGDRNKKITKKRIERFIDDNINSQNRDSIEGMLQRLESTLVSETNTDNLVTVMERIEKRKFDKNPCGRTIPHLILYQFYLTIAGIELLGLASLSTGYALNELLHPEEKAADELPYLTDGYQIRMAKYAVKFSEVLKRLARNIIICDPGPGNYIRDKTFVEMWGSIQFISQLEHNIWTDNYDCGKWSCPEYNGYYAETTWCYTRATSYTKWKDDNTPEDYNYCTTPRRCRGKLRRCWNEEFHAYCYKTNSTRRYEWIQIIHQKNEYDERPTEQWAPFSNDCDRYEKVTRRPLDKHNTYCYYCFCWCEDNAPESTSVHLINLRPVRANTKKNRVIIGVRFTVFENILHIQIKDGLIVAGYRIANVKKQWIPLPSLKDDIYKSRKNPEEAKLKEDTDFSVTTEDHAFNIDSFDYPSNRLITGLKMNFVKSNTGGHQNRIQLQVETMEYDYKTGKLKQGSEEWTVPDEKQRSELKIDRDSPQHTKYKMVVDSKPDQYVVLQATDLHRDAGQSVIPFFEKLDVESIPNAPLSGIGLYHRGTNDTGGFLGFNVQTINFGEYLYDTYKPFDAEIQKKIKKIEEVKGKKVDDNDDNDEEYTEDNF